MNFLDRLMQDFADFMEDLFGLKPTRTPAAAAPGGSMKTDGMRTAVVYRTKAKALKDEIEAHNYGESDEPQFEFCVFTDGRVAQRWLIGAGSCVWWDSLEHLKSVHIYQHPSYGTEIRWTDGEIEYL